LLAQRLFPKIVELTSLSFYRLTGKPAKPAQATSDFRIERIWLFMTIHGFLFYVLAALILVTTGLAITRRNLVHAVVYLVLSFFGSAMLFYLLGAPVLAALEVIIYAGAIMILFLFIIMMLKGGGREEKMFPLRQWLPAVGLGFIYVAASALIALTDSGTRIDLQTAMASPRTFGQYIFQQHWLSIEIVSLLLLIALVGVLYLGMSKGKGGVKESEE
jgi:NADH-quinone oxidoreductase subunit J